MIITYKGQPTRTTRKMTKEEVLAAIPESRCWVRPKELCKWLGLENHDSNALGHQLSGMGFGKARIKFQGNPETVWYVGGSPVEEYTTHQIRSELGVNP